MRSARSWLLIAWTVLMFASPAAATPPLLTDIAGDANFAHETLGDTSPVSYEAGDLLAVTIETMYTATQVGVDGVDYEATGLRMRTRTTAPADTSSMPMAIRFGFDADACHLRFDTYLHGATGTYPPDWSVEWWQEEQGGECPSTGSLTWSMRVMGWAVSMESDETIVTIPYAVLSPAERTHFAVGRTLGNAQALTTVALGTQDGARAWFPWMDFALDQGNTLVIGSDIPPDVPCTTGCD